MYYFKSYYDPKTIYPEGWYGEFEFAPDATVLLYNDQEGFCIGYLYESMEDYRVRMIREYWKSHEDAGTISPVEYDIDKFVIPEHFNYITEEEARRYLDGN